MDPSLSFSSTEKEDDNHDHNGNINKETDEDFEVEEEDDEESYTEGEFYGLDVLEYPPDQIDDELQYLSPSDRYAIAHSSDQNWNWKDRLASDPSEPVEFALDDARIHAWDGLQEEVKYIRAALPPLLQRDNDDPSPIRLKEILDLLFGKQSEIAAVLCSELSIDRFTFVNFMATLCLQMTYHETPASLYDESSMLKDFTTIDKAEYILIWKKIATSKKIEARSFVGISRRPKCLWEMCETAANNILRSITIAGRSGEIAVALDDDKVWVESSGQNQEDDFKLRKVTHVKDNRKGIVSHTAVTTHATLILGTMFEVKGDTAVDCFKKLFTTMFPSNLGRGGEALPDLTGITNNSDRGYTIESTFFDFLIPSGADVNNTCKRIMPFPFIWGMKITARETRTELQEQGAPTLYIKEIMTKHNRLVTCAAFRTGTKNISTVVTTKFHGHRWEGICLNLKHRDMYKKDPIHGLDEFFLKYLLLEMMICLI